MCDCHPTGLRLKKTVSRREVLRFALAGTGIAALGPMGRWLPSASGAPGSQTRFVVVVLDGGNDSLNMVCPTTLQPYFDRRPGLAISPAQGLSMNTGPHPTTDYVFHPAMDAIASMWADGDVAVVQKVGYPQANLSHFTSQDVFSLAVRGSFGPLGIPESGWIARYADLHAPTPMGAVSIGLGRPLDFEGGTSNPLLINSAAGFRFNPDNRYLNNHLHRIETIKGVLDSFPLGGLPGEVRGAVDQAHDLSGQVQTALTAYTSPVVYPTDAFGRRMRDVAVLTQGGFETRIFYTGFGGFDLHSGQGGAAGAHADLLSRLDNALGAFAADMKAMGVWDTMVIEVITEFGRRNYKNGSDGTDHGHGFAVLLLGGAVNGGLYGPALVDADINAEYLSYEVDFRDVYKEVLSDHLGADPLPVFPEAQPKNTTLGVV
jgi:uncharacterized protein (DUF1501 family)